MAQSATVGLLRVLLTASTAEFEAAMKRASDTAKVWTKDLNQIGRQAEQVGSALTKTLTVPLVAAFAGAAKAAIDFESSFANVAKTVDGVADSSGQLTSQGKALAQTFRNMAKEIPATTDELNQIAALGGQMGVPIKQMESFTRNVAALGVAVDGISTEEAAAGLAQIGNITGQGTQHIDKMASALVHLGNSSNATESDILEFTKRLSGAGHAVGMTVPEIMAISTAMANVGINAEAGGTAMSTMIAKMSKAVSQGGAALQEFDQIVAHTGRSFTDLWKDSPVQAVDAVVQGLNRAKANGEDLNIVVGKIGATNIRTADTMKRLAGAGDGVAVSLKTANEGWATGNKHLEEAEKKYATTANQIKLLWNHVKDVGITFGNALLPAIRSAVQVAGSLVPIVDLLAKAFAAMPGPMQLAALGIAGALAAAGPLIWAFGQLALAAGALTGAFTKNGIATRALTVAQGQLTASTVTLSGAVRAAGAAMLAMPVAAIVAGMAAIGAAIVAVRNRYTELADEAARAARNQVSTGGEQGRANVAAQIAQKERELAEAVRDGNKALAARLQAEVSALKNDQTRLAMLDTINRAIERGADKNITYAEAVTFLQQKERERLAGLQQQAVEQQAANRATETATQKTDRLKQAQEEIAAANKKYAQELTGIRDVLKLQIENMDKTGKSTKDLAEQYKISEDTVKLFKAELEGSTKAHKEAQKAATEAEKAAEKHAQAIAKQADALEKLGVVTENKVLKELAELNELIQHATDAGVPLDKVLLAIAPRLEELRRKAEASGIKFDAFATSLNLTTAAARRMLDQIASGVPRAVTGLTTLPGTVVKLSTAADIAAKNMADSFKFFGLSTRAELEATARAAVAHYNTIKDSGQATPEQIRKAFEQMTKAQEALSGKVTRTWKDSFSEVAGALHVLSGAFDNAFGDILQGAAAVLDGIVNIANATTMLGKITAGLQLAISLGRMFVNLFRDEEHEAVNDQRDEFLSQFGPGGTGPGSGFGRLAAQMAALGRQDLFRNLIHAKTVKDFEAAMQAIEDALKGAREEMARIAREGGTAGPALKAFMEATADSAETIEFIKGQTQNAAEGFNNFLQAGATAYEKLAELRKKHADASGEERDKLADEITKQERLIAAIGIAPAGTLQRVRAAMSPEELESLAAAYTTALMNGFKGTEDEFLKQQLEFYEVLDEGDERLKTWFSGATIDAFAKASDARLAAAKAAMSPDELRALHDAYQDAIRDGFKGTQDEFLKQQLILYSILDEGDERLKTWFSGATLDAFNSIEPDNSVAESLGAALAGTFGALVEQGMSARDALTMIEPGIAGLRAQLQATGQSGGEAFDYLTRLAAIAADEIGGPALDAISNLSKGLEGAHNAGFLTQEMFTGITEQIMRSRQAILDQGHSSEDVNRMMQRELQNLWQLHKDFNYEVDEGTQKLLDEAEAAGTVGDKFRSPIERAALAVEKLVKTLEKGFGIAGDEAEKFGGKVDKATRPRSIKIDYETGDFPEVPGYTREDRSGMTPDEFPDFVNSRPAPDLSYAMRSGLVTARGVRYLADSGPAVGPFWRPRGTDTIPAMLSPGEVVLNEGYSGNIADALSGMREAMAFIDGLKHDLAPLSSMGSLGGSVGPMHATVILEVDGRAFGRAVVPVVPGEARRLGVRVRN